MASQGYAPAAADSPGYALQFDGANDYVTLNSTRDILGPNWQNLKTVSLWIKPTGSATVCAYSNVAWCDHIFGDRPRTWGIARGIIGADDRIWVWNFDSTVDLIGIPYVTDEWIHISLIHENGVLSALRNGVLVSSIASGATQQPGAPSVLQLGGIINATTRNWTFQGVLDEVQIWNTGRSATQIQADMSRALGGDEPGLVAYYRMSDGAGLNLTDDSFNNWDGMLYDGNAYVPPDGSPPQWIASDAYPVVATPTPTVEQLATATTIPTATATNSPTTMPTGTATPPPTPTPEPTATTVPTATNSPTTTATGTATPPPTPTPEQTATTVPTATNLPTTTPMTPGLVEVSSYDTSEQVYDVELSGNLAYIANVGGGLQILDVSDPSAPSLIGTFDTPGRAYGVAVVGNLVYVADGRSGLRILDVTDPTSPTTVGVFDTPDYSWDVAVSGTFAYIADRLAGLRILDVSDPTSPHEVGHFDTTSDAVNVVVSGNYAFLAAYHAGTLVLDVSDPTAPFLVSPAPQAQYSYGVTLSDEGLLYIADGPSGIVTVDVHDPTSPALVNYNPYRRSRSITLLGDYAFSAEDTTGVYMLNVSDPTKPTDAAWLDTPGRARGLDAAGAYAYVADLDGGLRVIRITGLQ